MNEIFNTLKQEFLNKLKTDISEEIKLTVKLKVELDGMDSVLIFTVKKPYIRSNETITIFERKNTQELERIISDKSKWDGYINQIKQHTNELAYNSILEGLYRINGVYEFYWNNCLEYFPIPSDVNGLKIPVDRLKSLGCQSFVYRIGQNCQTLGLLGHKTNVDSFLFLEMTVGVILRACILDSLYILAWGTEPELISAIASESFTKFSSHATQQHKDLFKSYKEYFNVEGFDKPANEASTASILAKLKKYGMKNAASYEEVYMHYSKYDHFSLIPMIFERSKFQKLAMIVDALYVIKHALCSLLTVYNKSHRQIFYEILGISMELNEQGNYIFSNKQEHKPTNGSSPAR